VKDINARKGSFSAWTPNKFLYRGKTAANGKNEV
jgi:hypothetical protein